MSHHPEAHDQQPESSLDTLGPDATWTMLETGAALAWWQLTRFLEVAGPEAVTFLDGITTQDVAGMVPGTARHSLFLTTKAKIIAPAVAYRAAADRVLLELDPEHAEELAAHLGRYRLRAKVEISLPELGTISLIGPEAVRHVDAASGWYESPAFGLTARTYVGTMDSTAAELTRLADTGIPLADPETVDAARISRGAPSLADLATGYMPAEVGGMAAAVSLGKGCYLGQEPVARLHYRGKPNRTLRLVALDQELPSDYFVSRPDGGDDGYLALVRATEPDGRTIGTITSWATAPSGDLVGLAILRREVEPGDELLIKDTVVRVRPRG